MTRTDYRLVLALIVSLLLHLLPLISELITPNPAPPPPPAPALKAELRPPPPPEQPPLTLPEQPPPKATPPKPAKPPKQTEIAGKAKTWHDEVRKQFKNLDERDLFYPAEAIARGLEGETLVLLILDEAGNAVAARVEQSSGHPILDNAALRAARSLRSLPADAPRETLIPVRFRLR
ncbi:MAG: energy transducer TonB [Azonexus sp.]|nr:energy transducer TonB [Azonexus sp.]